MKHSFIAFIGLTVFFLIVGLVISGTPAASAAEHGEEETKEAEEVEVEEPLSLTITASELKFEPAELTVEPGVDVSLTLVNKGDVLHDLVIEEIGEISAVEPGETGTIQFTAPSETTTLVFYCSIGDHRSEGMEGNLRVVVCDPCEEEKEQGETEEATDEVKEGEKTEE